MKKLYIGAVAISLAALVLAIGPYLPHPKRWIALANKPEVKFVYPEKLQTISVIIPTYNDSAKMLSNTINAVYELSNYPEMLEVIVIDGGSVDDTMDALREYNTVKVGTSTGGRGPAINAGIALSTGDVLLFLHSDCIVEPAFDLHLQEAFADKNVIMTSFEFNANSKDYPFLKNLETRVNLRTKYFWLPYGDQALAIRREDLNRYFGGAIPNFKMMEDFEFVQRVRDIALDTGRAIKIIPQKVTSSPRRFLRKGVSHTSMLNWMFVTAYVWGGATPDKIFNWYYN